MKECSGHCQRFHFSSSEVKVKEPTQRLLFNSNEVKEGSECSQRFHLNSSGFKQCRECSQRFHLNSSEEK